MSRPRFVETQIQSGIGEASTPTTAPAVADALFALTGKRLRKLPIRAGDLAQPVLNRFGDFRNRSLTVAAPYRSLILQGTPSVSESVRSPKRLSTLAQPGRAVR
jgi:hypothetical protein